MNTSLDASGQCWHNGSTLIHTNLPRAIGLEAAARGCAAFQAFTTLFDRRGAGRAEHMDFIPIRPPNVPGSKQGREETASQTQAMKRK